MNAIAPTLLSCLLLSFGSCSEAFVHVGLSRREGSHGQRVASETLLLHHDDNSNDIDRRAAISRAIHASALISATLGAFDIQPSRAGEVGNNLNAAVTQSDLGISVRRSIVRGAQMMDKIDGRWEKFSDDFGLGAERSKREARPEERAIPPLKPLDIEAARAMLGAANSAFLSIVSIREDELKRRIDKVDSLVRRSFERAGLEVKEREMDAETFNFLAYITFKAFNEILVEQNINFKIFRGTFDVELGSRLCEIFLPEASSLSQTDAVTGTIDSAALKDVLSAALVDVDKLLSALVSKGFVAATERATVDQDKTNDWSDDLSDLQFSIALDKDITQNGQLLLGEQGFRLLPDFARFAISSILRTYLSPLKQEVTTEEYFMDTSYSSDPDLFEVKQILLNIVIESI
jgi:hypothetical protein